MSMIVGPLQKRRYNLPIPKILCLLIIFFTDSASARPNSPCVGLYNHVNGVDRKLISINIQRYLSDKSIDVVELYSINNWYFVHVASEKTDDAFLFFNQNPIKRRPISVWAGAARLDEGASIRRWVSSNVPGIPNRLAKCFSWRVTVGRADLP